MTGKVARVFPDKGFGFIEVDGEQDYFFHKSHLVAPVSIDTIAGRVVEFQVGQGVKGPRAEKIQVLSAAV